MISTSSTEIRIVPVSSWADALRMRRIRNACRFYMTQDQSTVGLWQQWRFYRSLHNRADRLEAVLAWNDSTPIGYGLVGLREGSWWVSGGLLEEHRGQGYGKLLFGYLTARARLLSDHGTVYLEVLRDNEPARATYRSLGYREIGRTGKVITMVYP